MNQAEIDFQMWARLEAQGQLPPPGELPPEYRVVRETPNIPEDRVAYEKERHRRYIAVWYPKNRERLNEAKKRWRARQKAARLAGQCEKEM